MQQPGQFGFGRKAEGFSEAPGQCGDASQVVLQRLPTAGIEAQRAILR